MGMSWGILCVMVPPLSPTRNTLASLSLSPSLPLSPSLSSLTHSLSTSGGRMEGVLMLIQFDQTISVLLV